MKGYQQESEKQSTEWEEIFTDHIMIKIQCLNIYKLLQQKGKQRNYKMDRIDNFPKKNRQMANMHMKRCLTSSYVLRKMLI